MKLLLNIVFTLTLFLNLSAQEFNIVPYLKQVEQGETKKAEEFVKSAGTNITDPSILFLDAVVTTDGDKALEKYVTVYEKYPKSKYADAALFRIFSYYYSLGYYKRAESYLDQLKEFYPTSPYIKMADRDMPDEDLALGETPESTDSTQDINYNFTVQAGAFLNLDNAKNLVNKIKADGYKCEINTKDIGGSILNVVLVGQCIKREETQPILDYLKSVHKINGRIAARDK